MIKKVIAAAFAIMVLTSVFVLHKFNTERNTAGSRPVEEDKSDIVGISVEDIDGITQKEAEELCFMAFGDKDEDTGFLFSFVCTGAVKTNNKQYYVIPATWLVNNDHMSYIGDFFVSADGKEIYSGLAAAQEYTIMDMVWSKTD